MDYNKILEGFENSYFGSNLNRAAVIDNKVYLSNSGDFLMHVGEVKEIIDACTKYLEHITEQKVIAFNQRLLAERIMERDSYSRQKTARQRKPTFIYLMLNKRNGFYKIGRSDNPDAREKTLQSEEPEIELVHSFTGTSTMESRLHDLFDEKRIRGEWFKLDLVDVEFIKGFKEL